MEFHGDRIFIHYFCIIMHYYCLVGSLMSSDWVQSAKKSSTHYSKKMHYPKSSFINSIARIACLSTTLLPAIEVSAVMEVY